MHSNSPSVNKCWFFHWQLLGVDKCWLENYLSSHRADMALGQVFKISSKNTALLRVDFNTVHFCNFRVILTLIVWQFVGTNNQKHHCVYEQLFKTAMWAFYGGTFITNSNIVIDIDTYLNITQYCLTPLQIAAFKS